ncbi:MAG: hypothetical protein IJ301_04015 [Clostridia bacterium]|nr:hypothetical protein [Clostridia bacterium]
MNWEKELEEYKKQVKQILGKDSNFTYKDFIRYLDTKYGIKKYKDYNEYLIANDFTDEDIERDITNLTDGLINPKRCAILEVFKKPENAVIAVEFDETHNYYKGLFVIDGYLGEKYTSIFKQNGEAETRTKLAENYAPPSKEQKKILAQILADDKPEKSKSTINVKKH